MFKRFKMLVENECECRIKVLRSDNRTEYTCDKFDKFCEQAGIQHQLTVTYSTQKNGVNERKNRTVMEMARCLMFEKKLLKEFWAEAVNTSVYLLNRLPTKALENKTSYEAWHGVKPNTDHLRDFGSLCYAYIPDVKRDKLNEKVEIGMLTVYNDNLKVYRIYKLKSKKVEACRDIRINESSYWDWEMETSNKNITQAEIPWATTLKKMKQATTVMKIQKMKF